MKRHHQQWEGGGGAVSGSGTRAIPMLAGTPSQIEWAQRIRVAVNAEFDRVAEALVSATRKQPLDDQRDRDALLAILEEKRAEVMANDQAGYFIHEWQETGGRVRRMIMEDGRYTTIRGRRAERRATLVATQPADPIR